jgi:hypothetical protein
MTRETHAVRVPPRPWGKPVENPAGDTSLYPVKLANPAAFGHDEAFLCCVPFVAIEWRLPHLLMIASGKWRLLQRPQLRRLSQGHAGSGSVGRDRLATKRERTRAFRLAEDAAPMMRTSPPTPPLPMLPGSRPRPNRPRPTVRPPTRPLLRAAGAPSRALRQAAGRRRSRRRSQAAGPAVGAKASRRKRGK